MFRCLVFALRITKKNDTTTEAAANESKDSLQCLVKRLTPFQHAEVLLTKKLLSEKKTYGVQSSSHVTVNHSDDSSQKHK